MRWGFAAPALDGNIDVCIRTYIYSTVLGIDLHGALVSEDELAVWYKCFFLSFYFLGIFDSLSGERRRTFQKKQA